MQNVSTLTREQLEAMVLAFQAKGNRSLSCKVTDKGGLSVYGLGRFPVTLYRSQWEKLIEFAKSGALDQFIEANASLLSVKQ